MIWDDGRCLDLSMDDERRWSDLVNDGIECFSCEWLRLETGDGILDLDTSVECIDDLSDLLEGLSVFRLVVLDLWDDSERKIMKSFVDRDFCRFKSIRNYES